MGVSHEFHSSKMEDRGMSGMMEKRRKLRLMSLFFVLILIMIMLIVFFKSWRTIHFDLKLNYTF